MNRVGSTTAAPSVYVVAGPTSAMHDQDLRLKFSGGLTVVGSTGLQINPAVGCYRGSAHRKLAEPPDLSPDKSDRSRETKLLFII